MIDPKLLATVHVLNVVVLRSARGNHELLSTQPRVLKSRARFSKPAMNK